jgi:hypothetical protein
LLSGYVWVREVDPSRPGMAATIARWHSQERVHLVVWLSGDLAQPHRQRGRSAPPHAPIRGNAMGRLYAPGFGCLTNPEPPHRSPLGGDGPAPSLTPPATPGHAGTGSRREGCASRDTGGPGRVCAGAVLCHVNRPTLTGARKVGRRLGGGGTRPVASVSRRPTGGNEPIGPHSSDMPDFVTSSELESLVGNRLTCASNMEG